MSSNPTAGLINDARRILAIAAVDSDPDADWRGLFLDFVAPLCNEVEEAWEAASRQAGQPAPEANQKQHFRNDGTTTA